LRGAPRVDIMLGMKTTTNTATQWDAIWTAYIEAKRSGNEEKAAELKGKMERFESEVLGL
jgi:hypothetical protein